jgi:hypothetical protein
VKGPQGASQGRVGGALHSGCTAPADVAASNRLSSDVGIDATPRALRVFNSPNHAQLRDLPIIDVFGLNGLNARWALGVASVRTLYQRTA